MSLRTRLTLLFTSLLGGLVLIGCTAFYFIASQIALQNIENDLKNTAQTVISSMQVNPDGQLELTSFGEGEDFTNYPFQVWGIDGNLKISQLTNLTIPMNKKGKSSRETFVETLKIQGAKMRVLSEPIYIDQKWVGVIQLAANLVSYSATQALLATILIITNLGGMAMTAGISWTISNITLKPLSSVVNTANQIIKVDDLSKRIPVKSERKDEVGVLIRVINQALERIEILFSSQQRFLADVSHDLRTPLTVIKGNAELMRRTGKADEESLDSISHEVNRLTHMVGDLLLLAQAEAGKLPLEWKPIRLDELLEDVVKSLKPLADGKVDLSLSDLVPTQVMGDSSRLKQVFENLINNAIQNTPKDGKVAVRMKRNEKAALVDVSDTGPGISPQDLPHIFERFFRSSPSRQRGKEMGFGLGLSISDWIVRAHHGEITVKSELWVGTTFTVKLDVHTVEK
jgi:two-component system OmpR family sensor kinase